MNRIIVVGDLHFGMRKSSKTFHEILMKELNLFLSEVSPEDSIVILGDIFESRSSVDFKILNDAWDFFIAISRKCKELFILAGNHDEYYKEFSREHTNCRFLEFEPGSDSKIAPVKVVTELSEISIAGLNCLFIPWIDTLDKKNAAKSLLTASIDVAFGHFDLQDLYTKNPDHVNDTAFEVSDFALVPRVLSGHYHKRITRDNIQFVGSFIGSTFNDIDDIKGIHFITKLEHDVTVEFKANTCPKFHYLTVENPIMFIQSFENADIETREQITSIIQGNFIKIFLNEYKKENDDVYKIIQSMNPIDVSVVFNRNNFNVDDDEINFDGFDNKTDISIALTQYIDTIKDKLPSEVTIEEIKNLIHKKNLEYKQTTIA